MKNKCTVTNKGHSSLLQGLCHAALAPGGIYPVDPGGTLQAAAMTSSKGILAAMSSSKGILAAMPSSKGILAAMRSSKGTGGVN